MKTPVILLSMFFVLGSVSTGFSAAAKKTNPTQAASTSYSQAMYQCASQYAGNRGYLGRDRGGYIEACFKSLTGKWPADVGQNCPLRRC
jgi:hypothetical protein